MRYDAFISYRHSDLDMYVAKKIHKGLETFKVPRAVAKKTGKKNIKRVFRDQEELPIGSDLGDNIESALAESEYLLVICSPRTPESYWVQKEISTFIQMHGREHVLAVLVEGEPDQSFPEQLLVDDEGKPVEPLAADVRGDSKREINKKLKTELLRLAAPLLHCSYDDLRQRHKERRIKRIAAISAAVSATVAAVAIAFGAYSAYNAAIIQENYEGKQRNQSKYLAETSLRLLEEGDRRAAVLVALEALPSEENERPYVAEAQYALSQALYAYDTGGAMQMDRVLQHDLPVKEFYFNEAGTRAVSVDQGSNVYVWNVDTGEKLAQIAPKINEYGYIEDPKGAYIFEENIIICDNEELRALKLDGQEVWCATVPEGITYCAFDEIAQMVACVNRGEVLFFDAATGEKVATMPNQQETSYSAAMAYSEDKTKFAVSHFTSDEDATSGWVSVYDLTTKQIYDVETVLTYITDIAFTEDDCLVVALNDYNNFLSASQNISTGYIQKINYRTGEVLWQDSYKFQWVGNQSASTQIKCRNYQDASTGEIHNEVMMSVDNTAYTWDNMTGECLAEIQVDGGIVSLLVAANTRFGFLGQNDGTVDIVDMGTGTRYSDSAIETGKLMRQMAIKNGTLVFRSYASPDLTIMKYPDFADALELETYSKTIREVQYSNDETYYAVWVYDFDVSNRVSFYRTSDNSLVREWVEDEEYLVNVTGFIGDDTYVAMTSDNTVIFYEVESGEKEILNLGEDFSVTDYYMNKDKSLALAYSGSTYCVVDLHKREILSTGEIEGFFLGAVLSENGSQVYCSVKEQGVCIIDVDTGLLTPIEVTGYQMVSGSDIHDEFATSNNGGLLAVACADGKLRILDVAAMETIAEIPFTGVSRCFIRFTDDDTKLMMQGDDYYFRVYDLAKEEFAYVATEQYYQIENIVVDENSGTISLITMTDMVLLNAADFERSAQVEGGRAYLPQHEKILGDDNGVMYQFPYMTLEMLRKEAQEQFGGEELTDLERTKYNVE